MLSCSLTSKRMAWLEDLGYTVVVIYIEVFIGVITSVLSFLYIFLKLKLNRLIKGLLIVMAVQNGFGFIVIFISLIIMKYSVIACYPLVIGSIIGVWSNGVLTPMISMVKYYMTGKASKAQIANEKCIMIFLILGISFTYSVVIMAFIIVNTTAVPSYVSTCTGQEPTHSGPPIVQVLFMGYTVLMLVLGLYCDISLYFFMKSRNVSQQSNLVPWKSNAKKEALSIPIIATAIGIVSFGIIFVYSIASLRILFGYSHNNGIVGIISMLWAICLLPMLLIFTVKNKQKVDVQPPKQLQFHESFEMKDISIQDQGDEPCGQEIVRESTRYDEMEENNTQENPCDQVLVPISKMIVNIVNILTLAEVHVY